MKNRWTLHVEDFGSIRSADIEVAPMMLFVGPNNTGKSYLASLLWGILDMGNKLFPKDIPTSKTYKRCESLIKKYFSAAKSDSNERIWLKHDIVDAEIEWFSEILNNEKDRLLQGIFSTKGISISNVYLKNIKYSRSLFFIKDVFILLPIDNPMEIFGLVKNIVKFILTDSILDVILDIFDLKSLDLYRTHIILPASRTGFILSYKPLAADLMNLWGLDKQEVQTTFALPTIRFLQKLIKAEMSSDTPFADIAESLEKQILKGKIIQNSQTQSFYYAPESNPTNLMPLHTTSSLVTELAPLIIFLKDRLSKFNLLVFEEPESHLHLEAQRILARHLVKLVNRGVPVWMTTHSDTMFQQFNNLLASNEKRIQKLKNLSYQDDEMIKPEDIKAYQFNIAEDGKTDVVPLEQTEDGLIAPTFNKTIIELSEEAIHLEKDSEDVD